MIIIVLLCCFSSEAAQFEREHLRKGKVTSFTVLREKNNNFSPQFLVLLCLENGNDTLSTSLFSCEECCSKTEIGSFSWGSS